MACIFCENRGLIYLFNLLERLSWVILMVPCIAMVIHMCSS
ncbi:putative membrane protein [Anaplasma phagocytophilum str. CR1007]|uniref:Putative membrane protein n=1 Tax=Anaplasma phagocytophilum str. NCH-1 TaxID=1359161 RepID=A0A0F3N5S1_ANAPH|nr:putative membrane protein [Anaplasma phagocytophilum str. NCH-1]KJZ99074.1 putative membrane protein [Anaplasma phagocytophilum str. CR1007]